jgi:hypothetical protein
MPSRVCTYQQKVSAMCARPDLASLSDREDFLRRLVAYWTRQLNLHTRGIPIPFTPLEVDEIIDHLETLIQDCRNGRE